MEWKLFILLDQNNYGVGVGVRGWGGMEKAEALLSEILNIVTKSLFFFFGHRINKNKQDKGLFTL